MNLIVLGLMLDILGVSILVFVTISDPWHGRREDLKWWKKRYWWNGWRPFYKNTQTLRWVTKWNRKPVVHGIVPPKHRWNIIGFLFILIGFILQLKFYIS